MKNFSYLFIFSFLLIGFAKADSKQGIWCTVNEQPVKLIKAFGCTKDENRLSSEGHLEFVKSIVDEDPENPWHFSESCGLIVYKAIHDLGRGDSFTVEYTEYPTQNGKSNILKLKNFGLNLETTATSISEKYNPVATLVLPYMEGFVDVVTCTANI